MAHLLVVVGWLLTPGWAWAASHVGLWLGALVALRFENPVVMLAIAGAGALLFGFAVLWTWVRFMRRLRHLLARTRDPGAHPRQSRSTPRLLRCGLGAASVSAPLEVRSLRPRRSVGGCLH